MSFLNCGCLTLRLLTRPHVAYKEYQQLTRGNRYFLHVFQWDVPLCDPVVLIILMRALFSFTIYFISPWEIYSFPTSVTYQLLGNKGLCHYGFHASICKSTCACLLPFSFKKAICPSPQTTGQTFHMHLMHLVHFFPRNVLSDQFCRGDHGPNKSEAVRVSRQSECEASSVCSFKFIADGRPEGN